MGRQVHNTRDVLRPAPQDDLALCGAVHERYEDVLHMHQRLRGTPLVVPSEIGQSITIWQRVLRRHMVGDLRQSLTERDAIRTVAQWTLDQKCALAGQPRKVLQWQG